MTRKSLGRFRLRKLLTHAGIVVLSKRETHTRFCQSLPMYGRYRLSLRKQDRPFNESCVESDNGDYPNHFHDHRMTITGTVVAH
jgi:hypothetical protein